MPDRPTLLLAGLLIAGAAGATEFHGGTPADHERFREIQDTWISAYVAGDIDTMMRLFDEEVIVMAEGQPTVVGKAAAREYFAERAGRPGLDFADDLQEVRIEGDWAFVRGAFSLSVTPEGESEPAHRHHGRYFVLFRRNADGKWRVFRDMDNALPAPRQAP